MIIVQFVAGLGKGLFLFTIVSGAHPAFCSLVMRG